MNMKRLFALLATLTLVFALASCGGSVDTDDTSDAVTDIEVGDKTVSDVVFTPGSYSGTLAWSAVDGAVSYDVYMKYTDSVLDMHTIAEGVTDTTVTLKLDYGRHAEFKIIANGADGALAESEIIEGKSNGIRANEFAERDDILRYIAPKVSHEGLGILYINGEIWISDGGNSGKNNTKNALMDLRMKFLEGTGYINQSSCKLAINLYITHYHGDHVGALMDTVIPNDFFTVEKIYSPANLGQEAARDPNYDKFQRVLARYCEGTNYSYTEVPYGEKMELSFENSVTKVTFYPAIMDWSLPAFDDKGVMDRNTGWGYMLTAKGANNAITLAQNTNSLWAVFEFENTSVLFTGDTYHNDANVIVPMLDYYGRENFDVDVLVYLHHGNVRFSQEIYDVCTPEYTVYNSHTLDQDAVNYANKVGTKTYWAYLKAFIATFDGETVTMNREPDTID